PECADQQAALDWMYKAGFVLDHGQPPPQAQASLDQLDAEFSRPAKYEQQTSVEDRAIAYLRKCPPAISGCRGHNTTLAVARAIVYGFDLGVERGFDLLWLYWNPICQGPWPEADLLRKCREADRLPFGKPRGYLLNKPPAPSVNGQVLSASSTSSGGSLPP